MGVKRLVWPERHQNVEAAIWQQRRLKERQRR
jgi:hypothetical protein